jgi:hypothetical protein
MMKQYTFKLTHSDEALEVLVKSSDHKTLAIWAIDCVKRVMSYFEQEFPNDQRPRQALKTLQNWIDTGQFSMAVIRKASLDSHAAAREVGKDTSARSAARAAGQAVATAHVPKHAYGSAIYAQQAIFRATNPSDAEAAVTKERNWQYQRLVGLRVR